jgi:hypothetical protein
MAPTAMMQVLPKPSDHEDEEDATSPLDEELRIVLGDKVVPVDDVEDILADEEEDQEDVQAAEADENESDDETSFLFGDDAEFSPSKRIRGGL